MLCRIVAAPSRPRGPLPETPVEYDSRATSGGSTPKAAAVSALCAAMAASCSESGATFTAQSPKTSTCGGLHQNVTLRQDYVRIKCHHGMGQKPL